MSGPCYFAEAGAELDGFNDIDFSKPVDKEEFLKALFELSANRVSKLERLLFATEDDAKVKFNRHKVNALGSHSTVRAIMVKFNCSKQEILEAQKIYAENKTIKQLTIDDTLRIADYEGQVHEIEFGDKPQKAIAVMPEPKIKPKSKAKFKLGTSPTLPIDLKEIKELCDAYMTHLRKQKKSNPSDLILTVKIRAMESLQIILEEPISAKEKRDKFAKAFVEKKSILKVYRDGFVKALIKAINAKLPDSLQIKLYSTGSLFAKAVKRIQKENEPSAPQTRNGFQRNK